MLTFTPCRTRKIDQLLQPESDYVIDPNICWSQHQHITIIHVQSIIMQPSYQNLKKMIDDIQCIVHYFKRVKRSLKRYR